MPTSARKSRMPWQSESQSLQTRGTVMCRSVFPPSQIQSVIHALNHIDTLVQRRTGVGYAARNVLQHIPHAKELTRSPQIATLLQGLAGPGFFPVRGILFDKLPGANWPVGWHQDQVIPVHARVDAPGFGPWSVKAGVPHVRPPVEVLMAMLTLRIHLDDASEANGALKVIPGSHTRILHDDELMDIVAKGPVQTMEANAGDVLAMRPLILHASAASQNPGHRRVLHIEFARDPLPNGIQWPQI